MDIIERWKKLAKIPYEVNTEPQKLGQRKDYFAGARIKELLESFDEEMEKIKEIEKGIRKF